MAHQDKLDINSTSLSRRKVLTGLVALTGFGLLPSHTLAKKPSIYSRNGLAIRGYDPVAYFVLSKATKGSSDFELYHQGTTFRFANADNLEAFKSNPDKYTPQYGGYCAWAVSHVYTASIHPTAWTVVDDKLFLNYSRSVRRQWLSDQANRIKLADQNWPAVLDK